MVLKEKKLFNKNVVKKPPPAARPPARPPDRPCFAAKREVEQRFLGVVKHGKGAAAVVWVVDCVCVVYPLCVLV